MTPLSTVLLVASIPASALAQDVTRGVGGHIGLATPLVTVTSDETTTISDQFTLVAPIGVTVKTGGPWAVDFEMQVGNPVDPTGTTGLVIAPGLIYNFGPFAAGLRVASVVNAPSNVGLIPLINKGLFALGGGAMWFLEAAFPTFVNSKPPDVAFNVVVHTGIGF